MNNISDIKVGLREKTVAESGGKHFMLSAPDQCELMEMMVKLTGAKKGIEVGTFTGYSALCFALGLPDDGTLIACDISEEKMNIGKPFWE